MGEGGATVLNIRLSEVWILAIMWSSRARVWVRRKAEKVWCGASLFRAATSASLGLACSWGARRAVMGRGERLVVSTCLSPELVEVWRLWALAMVAS